MALKPFNSIGGFSVGEVPSNVILANGDITTTNITTTGVSNLNSIGNVRISGGTVGQVITTDGAGNLTFSTVDTSIISNGTSNVSVASNGNVTTAVAGNAIFTVTTLGANLVGNLSVGGILTDNIYYANGTPWDMQQPAGANNQIQFNSNGSFGASANFEFDDANTTLTVGGDATANITVGNSLFGTTILGSSISVGNLDPFAADYAFIRNDIISITGDASTGNAYGFIDLNSGVGYATDNIYSALNSTGLSIDSNTSNAVISLWANGAISATNSNDTYFSADGNSLMWTTAAGNGFFANANIATHTSKFQAPVIESNVATGTAPFIVTSTTQVANLNVATAGTAGTVTTAAQPNITSVGNLTGLTVGNATSNVVIADTGTINATGNVTAPYFFGNVVGNISGNIVVPGSNTEVIFNNEGNAGASNAFTFNNSTKVLTVTGNISASGDVAGATLTGNLTTAAQPNITSVGTLTSLTVTGDAVAGNVYANSGTINATNLGGTLSTAAQPNITSVGTLTSLDVTGNIAAAIVTANTKLVTDSIQNKSGNLVVTSNANILLSTTGIIDAGSSRITSVATPTSDADAATKAYVDNLVSSGIHYHAPVRVESPIALNATYDNGTAGVGATLTNAGANAALVIDGVTLSTSDRVLVYQQANAVQNGVYVVTTAGSGSVAWVLTRSADADTSGDQTDTSLDEGSYFFVQEGTTGAGESYVCSTPGTIVFGTTEINFAQFSKAPIYTAGTGLTLTNEEFSITNTTVSAGSYGNGDSVSTFTVNAQGQLTAAANVAITANAANLTGTVLNSGIVTSSLTTVGTLGSLAVTGNITSGNVYANAGTIGANIVTASTLTGTLSTAAQPNVTSVGTLTSLDVTGNVAAGNVSATNVSGTTLTGTLTTAAQPNVTSVGNLTSLTVTGNVGAGNISATSANLTTANVSGNVIIGSSTTSAASVTTTAVTAAQTIAEFPVSTTTGIEFLVKGVDSSGSKYSVAKVVAVTNGTSEVDYTIFATVNVGTATGSGLQVVLDGGNVKLQVTPSSSNSTVWTTQYNLV